MMHRDMKTFKLTIARVDGSVYDAPAVSVNVPGAAGDMTVLADHEAFISPLRSGTVTVHRADGDSESFDCDSGTIEVGENEVSILL